MTRSLAQSIPLLACIVGAWIFLAAGSVLAAPGGELDATFGENGRLTIEPGGFGLTVAQQANGKLLVVGSTSTDFAVIRLNADGTRDNSFGRDRNGIVTVGFTQPEYPFQDAPLSLDVAMSVAVQPDGKILTAGRTYRPGGNVDFALARLNPDGSLDNGFGGDGRVTLDLGRSHEQISGMVLLDDRKIVVAGHTDANGDYDVVFARFNANGSLDTSFGTAGTTLVDSGTHNDQPHAIARQPDGKFIACGVSEPAPAHATNGAMLAVRANEDGSVDTTYGSNGVVLIQSTAYDTAWSCVALPDGSGATVLAGSDRELDDTTNIALVRLEADGSLDPSFGAAGRSSIDLGGGEEVLSGEEALSIVVLDDGKLAIAGRLSTVEATDIFLARIDAGTGTVDPTFGNQGVTVVDFGQAALHLDATVLIPSNDRPSHGYGLIQQRDGKLVAVGTQHYSLSSLDDHFVFAIARVDPVGAGNVGVVGFVPTDAAGTHRIVTTVREGSANAVLDVRRTGGSVGEVAVDYTFVDGTARSPEDFTGVNGSLTWPDGDVANKTIAIPITDDTTAEDVETFSVTLSSSFTPGLVLAATEAEVSITNDDSPGGGAGTIELVTTASTVSEGGSLVLGVMRTGGSSGAVSVDYTTSSGTATAGTDFTTASGTLSWADGDTTAKTITVNITNDSADESDETFTVTLSNPSNGVVLGPGSSATVTIIDDDSRAPPPVSIDRTAPSVGEAGGSVVLDVSRSGTGVGAVSVNYATSSGSATAGSDFASASGALSWADGDTAVKTITVNITNDSADESDETFTVTLSDPSNGVVLGPGSSATVTIIDDDSPPPPPPAVVSDGVGNGNGGGGSSDRLLLLGFLLLGLARKRAMSAADSTRSGHAAACSTASTSAGSGLFRPSEIRL